MSFLKNVLSNSGKSSNEPDESSGSSGELARELTGNSATVGGGVRSGHGLEGDDPLGPNGTEGEPGLWKPRTVGSFGAEMGRSMVEPLAVKGFEDSGRPDAVTVGEGLHHMIPGSLGATEVDSGVRGTGRGPAGRSMPVGKGGGGGGRAKGRGKVGEGVGGAWRLVGMTGGEADVGKSKLLSNVEEVVSSLKSERYQIGEGYPKGGWEEFGVGVGRLVVKGGGVASWAGDRCEGVFLGEGKIKRGQIIGVYGGKVVGDEGPYVLEMTVEKGLKLRVDGSSDGSLRTIFGMLNEDIHGGKVKVK